MQRWSTGRDQPRCIYRGTELIGMALTIDDAALIVRVMNDRQREALARFDTPPAAAVELPDPPP